MTQRIELAWLLLCIGVAACYASPSVAIRSDDKDPQVAFAAAELQKALQQVGCVLDSTAPDLSIVFDRFELGMGPQSFRIRKEGPKVIRVVGGDSTGAMYGGLELAEQITLGKGVDAIQEKARKPYVLRRGLKFNIPWDGRSPSYDDTGTAAQQNIPVMWEWAFWKSFLEILARDRYNVLTLWTTHPYPGIVRLSRYPGVNYDDVCVIKRPLDTRDDLRHFDDMNVHDPNRFNMVKRISLDDKIAFWTKVFNYAQDLGIEVYVFHWNIYTFGAKGQYGITDTMDNPKTIDYMRYCIAEFLKTYPQIDGIGVTAGEHVGGRQTAKMSIEQWLWQTYGQGVMDAKAADPDREIRFIFRQHMANLSKIQEAFKDFDGPFNTGHKYARARLYFRR